MTVLTTMKKKKLATNFCPDENWSSDLDRTIGKHVHNPYLL